MEVHKIIRDCNIKGPFGVTTTALLLEAEIKGGELDRWEGLEKVGVLEEVGG